MWRRERRIQLQTSTSPLYPITQQHQPHQYTGGADEDHEDEKMKKNKENDEYDGINNDDIEFKDDVNQLLQYDLLMTSDGT